MKIINILVLLLLYPVLIQSQCYYTSLTQSVPDFNPMDDGKVVNYYDMVDETQRNYGDGGVVSLIKNLAEVERLGEELNDNASMDNWSGTFPSTLPVGWTLSGTATASNYAENNPVGKLHFVRASGTLALRKTITTGAKVYSIEFDVDDMSANFTVNQLTIYTPGHYKIYVKTGTFIQITGVSPGAVSFTLDNFSVKEVLTEHLFQSSTGNKPFSSIDGITFAGNRYFTGLTITEPASIYVVVKTTSNVGYILGDGGVETPAPLGLGYMASPDKLNLSGWGTAVSDYTLNTYQVISATLAEDYYTLQVDNLEKQSCVGIGQRTDQVLVGVADTSPNFGLYGTIKILIIRSGVDDDVTRGKIKNWLYQKYSITP